MRGSLPVVADGDLVAVWAVTRTPVANAPATTRAPMRFVFMPVFYAGKLPKLNTGNAERIYRKWVLLGALNLFRGNPVAGTHRAELEKMAQYILRHSFAVEKMTCFADNGRVIYHSHLNPSTHRKFEVFTATDFLAAITQHIPEKGAQTVKYYGCYSNKARGQRALQCHSERSMSF